MGRRDATTGRRDATMGRSPLRSTYVECDRDTATVTHERRPVVVATNGTTGRRRPPGVAERAWATLSAEPVVDPVVEAAGFDPGTLVGLPPPAQRLLRRVLPTGTALSSTVELSMEGRIRLAGRWLAFTAEQLIRAGEGLVWSPVVGGRLLRFVGADLLTADDARMEFRLHGLIPVVRADGPDIRRSAQGRLAGETAAWLPQALTPQLGARWAPVDDRRAVVTLAAAGTDVDVEVVVDDDGRLRRVSLDRWNSSADPPRLQPFGTSVDSTFAAANGVRIAGNGTVGWDFGTDHEAEGVFFRYRITGATFSPRNRPPVRVA